MCHKPTNSIESFSALILAVLLSGCAGPINTSGLPGNQESALDRSNRERPVLKENEPSPSSLNPPESQTPKASVSTNKNSESVLAPSHLPNQETALSVVIAPTPVPSDTLNDFQADRSLSEGLNLNSPVLQLQSSTDLVAVGDQFILTIKADQVRDLFSAPFYLRYDPQVLEFVGLTEGNFLKQDKNPTAFIYTVEPESGQVIVGLSRLGEVTGISGSGVLALATFKAKNPGRASVTFQNVDFRDTRFEPVPVTAELGEVQIR